MSDQYLTIKAASIGEFRDRGSKFIGYAFPLYVENDWQQHLEAVRKEHPKATHHCFAFRLGMDKNNYRDPQHEGDQQHRKAALDVIENSGTDGPPPRRFNQRQCDVATGLLPEPPSVG